jgi:DNA-binding NarL/FixJ family response regulator
MNQTAGCKILFEDCQYPSFLDVFQMAYSRSREDHVQPVVGLETTLMVAKEDPPDLIILSFWLREKRSMAIYRGIRAVRALRRVPVVLTGCLSPDYIYPRIRPLGVAGYLRLPCGPWEMLDARDTVLRGEYYYPESDDSKPRD